jgi:hypothetical protein
MVVISRNLKAMEKALQELVNTVKEMRLIINKKTNYMRVSKKMQNQIAVGGYRCERVFRFLDLGPGMNDNSISEEITHRFKKGSRAYYACK